MQSIDTLFKRAEHLKKAEKKERFLSQKIKKSKGLCHSLGGFRAEKRSIEKSAKKSSNALFGIVIDPFDGFFFLFGALFLFETLSIHFKEGLFGTLVYRIDNRRSIIERVINLYHPYIRIVKKEKE